MSGSLLSMTDVIPSPMRRINHAIQLVGASTSAGGYKLDSLFGDPIKLCQFALNAVYRGIPL